MDIWIVYVFAYGSARDSRHLFVPFIIYSSMWFCCFAFYFDFIYASFVLVVEFCFPALSLVTLNQNDRSKRAHIIICFYISFVFLSVSHT